MLSESKTTSAEVQWTKHQQQILYLLQIKENCLLGITELCRKAGFPNTQYWYRATKNKEFKKVVKALRNDSKPLIDNPDAQGSRKVPQWGETHQRLLDVLQVEENRQLGKSELCRKAGLPNHGYWYRALEQPKFREAVEALGVQVECRQRTTQSPPKLPPRSQAHQQLLDLLREEENRRLNPTQLCQKAGFASKRPWYNALNYPEFRAAVEALGVETNRRGFYFNDNASPKEPQWGETHQRLLDVLQVEENRQLSVVNLCCKAGFTHTSAWYRAIEHPQFRATMNVLGVEIERVGLYHKGQSKAQRAILAVLQNEANRRLPLVEICRKAGYSDDYWYKSLQSDNFVKALQVLGVEIRRVEYNENGWTHLQQSLLDVLQEPSNRELPITEICHLAGYPNCTYWFRAGKNPRFREAVEALGIKHWSNGRNEHGFTRAQQRFLDFLEENPVITTGELCRKLGYVSTSSWAKVIQDHHFIQELEARGIQVKRQERLKDGWTPGQKRIVSVLQDEANRNLPIKQVCQIAECSKRVWYAAVQNEPVVSALKDLEIRIQRCGPDEEGLSWAQQRLLAVLQDEANRNLPILELCQKARYSSVDRWYTSLTSEQFTQALQAWGVPIVRQHRPFIPHIRVELAMDLEAELNQDVWDIRRIKSEYPKHRQASTYILDFTWIENSELRQQIKLYLRTCLPKWKASTFSRQLCAIKGVLSYLPTDVHIGTITRQHIEAILPEVLAKSSDDSALRCLGTTRAMFQYMAHSPTWRGPRPPENLVDCQDLPSPADDALPRPIPREVLTQFDPLLEQAIQDIINGRTPSIFEPVFWDAILILRRTGMRFADLAHLEAPNTRNQGGCLGQDPDGDYWIHIRPEKTKMSREHQIPTLPEDGTVEAILRQVQRAKEIPDHLRESYLFRTEQGILTYGALYKALKKLSQHLTYLGQPYPITPHQFRHTIATDMINEKVDAVAVMNFLGHRSLAMTMRYVKVYNQTIQARYREYRARLRQQNSMLSSLSTSFLPSMSPINSRGTEAGWATGYEGKLYQFELLNGLGICEQPPGVQLSCTVNGQCSTKCPKLRAGIQHLPNWENRVGCLQKTIEALKGNSGYEWHCQQHEQELRQIEKVIITIQKEGFWDGRLHNTERS